MTDSPSLSGTPVLVTGATGFIGSRLVEYLATREGAVVTGLGRDLARVAGLRDQGVELVEMDLRAPSDLEEVLAGTELAFHVAGMADAETARAVNVEATFRWRFPNDKARERLGWAPQVDLEEGMERMTRWLTDEGPLSS
jgi:nucleoside-diphosphate-sugar epimerase